MKTARDLAQIFKTKLAIIAGVLSLVAIAMAATPFLPLHVHVGEKAPDFSLPSAEGSTVSILQFSGHNVLLDFYEGYW